MIVIQRPFTVYDVDLVGAGVCVALLAALCSVGGPLLGGGDATRQPRAAAVRADQQQTSDALATIRRHLHELESLLAAERDSLASVSDLPAALAGFARQASARGLELEQLAPQPGVSEGAVRAFDIRIAARGPAVECLNLLDDLRADYPWLVVRELELKTDDSGPCALSCTARWFARGDGAPRGGS